MLVAHLRSLWSLRALFEVLPSVPPSSSLRLPLVVACGLVPTCRFALVGPTASLPWSTAAHIYYMLTLSLASRSVCAVACPLSGRLQCAASLVCSSASLAYAPMHSAAHIYYMLTSSISATELFGYIHILDLWLRLHSEQPLDLQLLASLRIPSGSSSHGRSSIATLCLSPRGELRSAIRATN